MIDISSEAEVERIELKLLLEAVHTAYGYDFKNYSESSIRRRAKLTIQQCGFSNMAELIHNVLSDRVVFETLLLNFTINVTEMFRDPGAYSAIRENVLPEWAANDHVKIWHAGCSTGEEVYSMAILLKESGIYNKAQIYATDINEIVLQKAREGIYPSDQFRDYTKSYQKAGGAEPFTNYYTANQGYAAICESLKKHILFSDHNLVTDNVFGEMNLIICRNVLIYFDRKLQNRVLKLFADSLAIGSYLWLGKKETILLSDCRDMFEDIGSNEKIYRKIA